VIKLSLDDFIKLYKLASVGKLIGGLIHNINGPMQNMGLDIEMTYFSLKDESKWDKNIAKSIMSRLKRMEEEHEKINSLIRNTAARTQDNNNLAYNTISNIHDFLEQEFTFLHANLYFKHNIQTEIISVNTPPLLSSLSNYSIMALGWFLQSLVEELEKQKIGKLTIKIISDISKLKIVFSTQGGRLSEVFFEQFSMAMSSEDTLKPDNMDLGIFLIFLIFNSNGITFELDTDSLSSNLAINFPRLCTD
jgi:hypothetical protein